MVSPEDLARIVGPGAYDKDGQGNVNVGDGGVAFLLAATSSLPGGASTVSWQGCHNLLPSNAACYLPQLLARCH